MKGRNVSVWSSVAAILLSASWLAVPSKLMAQQSGDQTRELQTRGPVGPGNTIVKSQFGGQIFGFDIDQNGTEGVLSEAQLLPNGKVLAAVETFDQASGKILKVIEKSETEDDYITLGVAGTSVGLVEHEHVQGIYVAKRIYEELSPLDSNKFTNTWTPPLTKDDIIISVSRNQYSPSQGETNAVLAFDNGGNFNSFVFGSNIAANTSQPFITLTDT